MEKTYAQINREERDKIAIWKAEGYSIRVIASFNVLRPFLFSLLQNRHEPGHGLK